MNARLQVEHPITEMVTGIDLVRCQLEIAAGEPLRFRQEDIRPLGHAMECRVMAEDPFNDFLPSPGKIVYLHSPAGLGVRNDSGVEEGFVVPIEYDPLVSKLITWGGDRGEVIRRMTRALEEYQIYGIKTTIPLFRRILEHPRFLAGDYNTHFIPQLGKEPERVPPEEEIAAVIAAGIKSHLDSLASERGRLPKPARRLEDPGENRRPGR